jgi:glycosyltransferase involved in cell wall biosynthesis
MPQLLRDVPTLRLEIAGDGPCRPELRRLISELHLEKHAVLLGEVVDVPALLARASMFVLPSLMEGISLTLLEAMARGLPVVTTRIGGNPEVVLDGSTGILVPPQNPAELAAAMAWLARNPRAATEMGVAGRSRVVRHFDIRDTIARYETLYSQCRRSPFLPAAQGSPARVVQWDAAAQELPSLPY